MNEEVPRRMQRFYRKKPSESEVKQKSTQIAIEHVDNFVQRNNRYPNRDELDKLSQNIFDQLKMELKKDQEAQKFDEDIDLGPDAQQRNLADERKDRRAGRVKEEQKKKKTEPQNSADANKQTQVESTQPEQSTKEILEEDQNDLETSEELEEKDEQEEFDDKQNVEKLAEVDELGSLEDELSDDNFDSVEKEMTTNLNMCPRCNNKTEELIYCPTCGEAFCNHCAKAVEVLPDSAKYTCPKCSASFKKRKNR